MLTILGRTLAFLTILPLALAASAQHPLAGTWQEAQIGFLVTFEQQPGGQLTGTLQGQSGLMPLNIGSDLQNAQGSFVLDAQTVGFAAQHQPANNMLFIWLFEFDAAGKPLQDFYEQYLAYRAAVPAFGAGPPAPPARNISVVLGGGGNLPPPPVSGQAKLEGQRPKARLLHRRHRFSQRHPAANVGRSKAT